MTRSDREDPSTDARDRERNEIIDYLFAAGHPQQVRYIEDELTV